MTETLTVPEKRVPVRRGVARYLVLDFDADAMLTELAPHRKAQGRYISELLRAEVVRREERRKLKEAVMQAFEEPVCP
jgi:hypothetical protein